MTTFIVTTVGVKHENQIFAPYKGKTDTTASKYNPVTNSI